MSNIHTQERKEKLSSSPSLHLVDAAAPSCCRVSEVNLCVNKWWILSENLVTVGIRGVRVKSSTDIQEQKRIQIWSSSRKRPSYFMSTFWLHMRAENKPDGFIASHITGHCRWRVKRVLTRHTGSMLHALSFKSVDVTSPLSVCQDETGHIIKITYICVDWNKNNPVT